MLLAASCSGDLGSVGNNLTTDSPKTSQTPSNTGSPAPEAWRDKISSELLFQIDMKLKQMASPDPQRLKQMESAGMETGDLTRQKVFIHLRQPLTPAQVTELTDMNVTVYLDSWIPPVGVFPTGYYLAQLPVNMMDGLASKEYVVRLDTAEKVLEPKARPL